MTARRSSSARTRASRSRSHTDTPKRPAGRWQFSCTTSSDCRTRRWRSTTPGATASDPAPRRHRPDVEARAPAVDRLDPHRTRPGPAGPRLRQVGRPAGRPRVAAGVVRTCVDDDARRAERARVPLPSTPASKSRSLPPAFAGAGSRICGADGAVAGEGGCRRDRRSAFAGAAARARHRLRGRTRTGFESLLHLAERSCKPCRRLRRVALSFPTAHDLVVR